MSYLLIGLDGGATKIRGARLGIHQEKISLLDSPQEIIYRTLPGYEEQFRPIPLDIQLTQFRQKTIVLTEAEQKQGKIMVEAAAQLIQSLLVGHDTKNLILGIGMPGLKTEDLRGIAVMANGPRVPLYAKDLEESLRSRGVTLASPIAKLGSDADYCGMGENESSEGKMADAKNAYYLGVGTGVADAMKLDGKLVTFDEAKGWIAKSWEMASGAKTFEKCISMSALEEEYKERTGGQRIDHAGIIFERAYEGEEKAQEVLDFLVVHLVDLLYDRIHTLSVGGTLARFGNPQRPSLSTEHPFLGKAWDRLIVGQRLGRLWLEEKYRPLLQNKVEKGLLAKISTLPERIRASYLEKGTLRHNLIFASPLDTAPLLGAGIAAYWAAQKKER